MFTCNHYCVKILSLSDPKQLIGGLMCLRQGSFLIDLWSYDWLLIISHIKGRSSWVINGCKNKVCSRFDVANIKVWQWTNIWGYNFGLILRKLNQRRQNLKSESEQFALKGFGALIIEEYVNVIGTARRSISPLRSLTVFMNRPKVHLQPAQASHNRFKFLS